MSGKVFALPLWRVVTLPSAQILYSGADHKILFTATPRKGLISKVEVSPVGNAAKTLYLSVFNTY